MTRKLLTTTVIPLVLASAAAAQTDATNMPDMGGTWNDGTATVFFTDDGAMTLRDQAEIASGWTTLPETERAVVLADCVALQQSSAGLTPGSAPDGTTQNNASTYGEATAPVGEDTPETAPATSGEKAIGTVQTNPSTFGTAATGTDSTGTAASTPDTINTDSAEPMPTGTGGTNASTFGTANTGTGIDSVSEETWVKLCTVVADL